MRITLATIIGLALLTACGGGGSGTSSGTTTGAATTTGGGTTGAALLSPGKPCSANAACASEVCGPDGTGNCCAKACATNDGGCGASACDATGACVYPASGASCGTNCSQGGLVMSTCDGAGACNAGGPTACDGGFICAGGACKTSCSSIADCTTDLTCNNQLCVPQITTGACTENDDCVSDHCGTTGVGHCCTGTSACVSVADGGATCGAADCDATTGDCLYADAGTSCGSGSLSCTGDTLSSPAVCDGQGSCGKPKTQPCTPYVCGANACLTGCSDNTSCDLNDFCDVTNGQCCGGLVAGSTITVDSLNGSDTTACCGIGSNKPCLTLAQVMQSIDAAQAANVTIKATVNGGPGDWTPIGEVYPIVLGWGAELSAPGVYFLDPQGGNGEVIDIAPFSVHDIVASASIVGTVANPVFIGFDRAGDQSLDLSAVQVETGRTLYLANASLNGSATSETAALTVSAGASLVLGEDQSAAVTGTVFIGNGADKAASNGFDGIVCGHDATTGCTITDATLKASSVVLQGQTNRDIDAEDFASIKLTSAPVIGVAPLAPGFKECGSKPDVSGPGLGSGEAVYLRGTANVTFDNGTVQCLSGSGFYLTASNTGTPVLDVDGTTIQNTERAVYAEAGTATITNSTIQFNYNGVQQSYTATYSGTINLAGNDGGLNTVICSSKVESTDTLALNPGVSVLNLSNLALAADNVNWDTAGPDLFLCSGLTSCTCEIMTCTDSPGADGMDAVYESIGTVTTTNNGVSQTTCDPPPPGCGSSGVGCTPPSTCCVSLGQCLSPLSGIVCPPGK